MAKQRENRWRTAQQRLSGSPVKEEMRKNLMRPPARRRAALPRRHRLRGHRPPAARERAARRPRRDLPRRARPGEDPHDPLARSACSTSGCRSSPAARSTTTRTHPVSHARPRRSSPSAATSTPIEWVHRDDRFGEKLATPDTSIADLIGEVDPIKVAEGRYLSDELTIHYGLVPRTNRGIFAINELPDLAERIQVGLLNVLEERDVQIRGYKIRLPLDVMLVASRQPRGLHQPRPHHHAAEGPLRLARSARTTRSTSSRDRRSSSRRRTVSTADGIEVTVPDVHDRDRRRAEPAGAQARRTSTSAPACRCASRRQLRDAGRQRDAAGASASARRRSCRASATSTRWSRRPPARSRSRPSTTAARTR